MAGKDFAAIAAAKITRPSKKQRKPKFLIYSRNKKGKSTFGISGGVGVTLTIDPEHGTAEMRTKDPHVWPVDRWEDMDEVYNFLRYINKCPICPSHHEFEWVCVDGLTKINNMALKYVMRLQEEKSLDRIPGFVQQKDYGKSGELMKDLLTRFHNLDMGVVFTAQERQDDPGDSEEDEDSEEVSSVFIPDLPKAVRAAANSIVDVIGRLYVVKIDGTDGKTRSERRLWIGESVRYDTGYRSDYVLPDVVKNPTVPKLVTLIRTGELPKKKTTATKKTAVKKSA